MKKVLLSTLATLALTGGVGKLYVETAKEPTSFTVEDIHEIGDTSKPCTPSKLQFCSVKTNIGEMEYGGLFNDSSKKLEIGKSYTAEKVKGPNAFKNYLILNPKAV